MKVLSLFYLLTLSYFQYTLAFINKSYGIYRISSLSNNLYLKVKNDKIILLNIHSNFKFIFIKSNEYYIESIINKNFLGIDDTNKIKLYKDIQNLNKSKLIWILKKIKKNYYLIQNKFNLKFLEANNNYLQCNNQIMYSNKNNFNDLKVNTNFIFTFLKLYEEAIIKKNNLKIIKQENIDLVIKYIDLTDKKLKRIGIHQTYKDNDNEELRYSIRSILNYIPWVRRIYIIMPNEKVKFFKTIEEINDKIIYIKDKDLLGFDSANIFAFTFKLHFLEKFGISQNFIYMEDDFFIGKPLKKQDFFYYDEKEKKVYPYILANYFNEMNETEINNEFNNLINSKDLIFPHSRWGWWLSIYSTDKYFIERYKCNIIIPLFTHNAIAENINDLKEIYEEIKFYKYINQTLYSKERHILTLNQPHFLNLYQLNIKHKKVNPIKYRYIEIELIKKKNLNTPLFVINTGGNHIPLKRQYKIQKKILEKRFKYKTIFEIINEKNKKHEKKIKNTLLLKISIIILFLKIYSN